MADAFKQYDNNVHPFTFTANKATIELFGALVSWSGKNPRRRAEHSYLKRRGSRQEDMGPGPRSADFKLKFIGKNCVRDYLLFVDFVDKNPSGLLNHPIAGQWNAFCDGPSDSVDLGRSVNEIDVGVSFTEDNVSANIVRDIPDATSAAQIVTATQAAYEASTAQYVGEIAAARAKTLGALAKVQDAIEQVQAGVEEPLSFMRDTLVAAGGIRAASLRSIDIVASAAELMSQAIDTFVSTSIVSDVYTGGEALAGIADSIDTQVGVILDLAEDFEVKVIAAAESPAFGADVVAANDQMVAACLDLADALKADKPTLLRFVTSALTDVISIATQFYPGEDAAARASQLMSINRIHNPAAISAGTVLYRYAR